MTTITSTDLRNKSIGLYTPPFRFEHGYIWDTKGQMVADNHVDGEDAALRVRGWGRISYMENPEALQDEVGNVIALAMTEFWERRKAEMDSEPVAYMYDGEDGREYNGHNEFSGGGKGIPLYRHAQQPVVPPELTKDMEMEYFLRDDWKGTFRSGWDACRAAALKAGNSPVIPEGYVMVPKEPTSEMVKKMRYHVGGYDRNIKEGYKAMLAAAPQEVPDGK
ncbi:hypothetical protein FMJ13_03695 [Klebsiella michiganensis]|uniref:hypothetical protein n=1 Tax=Klebsiella michiganensis TaxID=1134687 RepID=UPI001CCE2D48|nr:hypothetical protein [Klebsiella michiganensis]MBZ7331007.1 hypothetical protein [Klebsiella michiganensis]